MASQRDGKFPGRVRATELILDDGRIFAQDGEVGEVISAETYPDGTHQLTVLFPNAPAVTTCELGVNVQPRLAVVVWSEEDHMPAPQPTPAVFSTSAARQHAIPRRSLRIAAGAVLAAMLAVAVWRACATPSVESEIADVDWVVPPAPMAVIALSDIVPTWGSRPLRLGENNVPRKPEANQKRPPCDREFGEREINGACYVAVADVRPPCGPLLEWDRRCVRPVTVTRPDNTIRR